MNIVMELPGIVCTRVCACAARVMRARTNILYVIFL